MSTVLDSILDNDKSNQENDYTDSSETSDDDTEIFHGKERVLKRLEKLARPSEEKNLPLKTPVWQDEDDESDGEVNVAKKRKWTQEERTQKFQEIVGEPSWVKKVRDSDSEEDDVLKTSASLVTSVKNKLRDGVLGIKRVRDLNRSTYSERKTTSIIFHPTSTVAICAGENGIANVYAVDGKKNGKLHSMGFENYQITSAVLVNGQELILGGRKPFFHTYDLISGKSHQIKLPKAQNVTNLKSICLSPNGKYLASIGKLGELHLFDSNTKELLRTFKQEYQATSTSFTQDSKYLLAHSKSNEVTIFDIHASKPLHKWYDEGCVNGTTISICNGLLATGSAQGAVNLYNLSSVFKEKYPTVVKSCLNLTTKITTTQFNPTSELLMFGSSEVAEAAKIVHVPSCSVYSNFPGTFSKIGQPAVVGFSPNSGYMAIGNNKSTIALFRLKNFSNY